MKYLLPCEKCGEKTPIDVNQAGQPIACCCGEMLEAPSLRGIRELARISDETAVAIPKRAWSMGRGIAFVTGLVIALVAMGAVAVFVAKITFVETPPPPVAVSEQVSAEIDVMSPSEAWDAWTKMRQEGLGPYHPPEHYLARQWIQRHKMFTAVAAVIAACALALSAGACLMPGAKRSR